MVSPDFRDYALEQIRRATPAVITHRAMFGGVGVYADGLFFALMADDVLYFKVDDSNRGRFESAGMGPFLPYGDPERAMSYYQVPVDVVEEPGRLTSWVDQAVAVARTARRGGKGR